MVQGPFQLSYCFLSQHVFDHFRIIMHVVRRNTRFIGQVQLPQAVVAHDFTGPLPAFRSKVH